MKAISLDNLKRFYDKCKSVFVSKETTINGKELSAHVTLTGDDIKLSETDVTLISTIVAETIKLLNNKQDQLTAGDNITIKGNVISANGGGVDIVQTTGQAIDKVMSQDATTKAVNAVGDDVAQALNIINGQHGAVGIAPVVQETGDSDVAVMSQDAVTKALASARGGDNLEFISETTLTEDASKITINTPALKMAYVIVDLAACETKTLGGRHGCSFSKQESDLLYIKNLNQYTILQYSIKSNLFLYDSATTSQPNFNYTSTKSTGVYILTVPDDTITSIKFVYGTYQVGMKLTIYGVKA